MRRGGPRQTKVSTTAARLWWRLGKRWEGGGIWAHSAEEVKKKKKEKGKGKRGGGKGKRGVAQNQSLHHNLGCGGGISARNHPSPYSKKTRGCGGNSR